MVYSVATGDILKGSFVCCLCNASFFSEGPNTCCSYIELFYTALFSANHFCTGGQHCGKRSAHRSASNPVPTQSVPDLRCYFPSRWRSDEAGGRSAALTRLSLSSVVSKSNRKFDGGPCKAATCSRWFNLKYVGMSKAVWSLLPK